MKLEVHRCPEQYQLNQHRYRIKMRPGLKNKFKYVAEPGKN